MNEIKFKWEARFGSEFSPVIRQYVGESLRHVNKQMMYDAKQLGMPYCYYGVTANGFVCGERSSK